MKTSEELLVRIIHFLAERYKTGLALEGGMLLRLLNCPRSTQDVDYILLSSESKKILAKHIKGVLGRMRGIKIDSVNLNSRGIFIDVSTADDSQIKAKIEIDVRPALNLPIESLSTSTLAGRYSLGGRIVSTIAMAEAFANKIAAALERDSVRDLYDLSQFEPLCIYDEATLERRLENLSVDRKKPAGISLEKAAELLRIKGARLTEKVLMRELYPLLPVEQRKGTLLLIKSSLGRLASRLIGSKY
ncbi:MAG: nucleotidyl transferase AbiEii/AbiGii toxin family protein [Pseudomonadota bacterium]